MSYSKSTLLLRNLSDVFGENDPVRRRAAIAEIFHEDAVFHDPKGGILQVRTRQASGLWLQASVTNAKYNC